MCRSHVHPWFKSHYSTPIPFLSALASRIFSFESFPRALLICVASVRTLSGVRQGFHIQSCTSLFKSQSTHAIKWALADVIDGMNLSEEWGVSNLDLSYAHDTRWAKWANERMERTNVTANIKMIPTNTFDRKSIWQKSVEGKQTRGGWKYPKDVYATRFRMHGSVDPRTRDRTHV